MATNQKFEENGKRQPKLRPKYSLTSKLFSPMKYSGFWFIFLILTLVGTFFLFGIVGQLGFVAILMFYAIHIFEISAVDKDDLTQYPSFDLFESLIRMVWFLYVVFIAIFPGAMLRKIVFFLTGTHLIDSVASAAELATIDMTPILISLFCMLGSFFLFLPILILSGMLNASPFNLYSPDILQSLLKQKKNWGIFYLYSFILGILLYTFLFFAFGGLFSFSQTLNSRSIFLFGFNMIAAIATTGTVFVYFRLLGRLAFVVGKGLKNVEAVKFDTKRQ